MDLNDIRVNAVQGCNDYCGAGVVLWCQCAMLVKFRPPESTLLVVPEPGA